MIWARPQVEGERLLQLDAKSLQAEINVAAGGCLGELALQAKASSYPLLWRVVSRAPAAAWWRLATPRRACIRSRPGAQPYSARCDGVS